MRRLYLQIYLAILAILVVFAVLAGIAWHHGGLAPREEEALEDAATRIADRLPPDRDPAAQHEALRALAATLDLDLSLWSAEGQAVAWSGDRLPYPGRRAQSGWMPARGGPVGFLHLPDGRWLVARQGHRRFARAGILAVLSLLAVAVAVGAYPVARRLTRRLERLRAGVEGLGAGDLAARVDVEGRDEVAALATTFNRAADRIEALVGAQRTLLAGASHELRSPLARIRVALELMGAERPDLRERVARDIAELDELIGELLLASRLQAAAELDRREEVDLLGLVAEEAARCGAEAGGEPATVRGDARLLRRLGSRGARHGRGQRPEPGRGRWGRADGRGGGDAGRQRFGGGPRLRSGLSGRPPQARGRSTSKQLPPPSRPWQRTSPPCLREISRTRASPKPEPASSAGRDDGR